MEFRYSRNILLYLHFVSTKRLIFCCCWGIIFGRKKLVCWKISVWLQKLCIFRVFFFLEWLKSCSSSVLLIIVLIRVLVMESLQAGTQKALDLNACKWEEMKLKLRSSSSCDSQGRRKFHSFCSFGTCWSSQAICFSMTCDQHHPSMSAHEYNCCLLQLGQYCEIPVQGFIQEVEIIKNNFFPPVPCVRFRSVTVFTWAFCLTWWPLQQMRFLAAVRNLAQSPAATAENQTFLRGPAFPTLLWVPQKPLGTSNHSWCLGLDGWPKPYFGPPPLCGEENGSFHRAENEEGSLWSFNVISWISQAINLYLGPVGGGVAD